MPLSTQHSLITWVPNSIDGKREAKKLNNRFHMYSVIKAPESLNKMDVDCHSCMIVVGHRGEFTANNNQLFNSLNHLVSMSSCRWIILANCDSGVNYRSGTLTNNELWSPAQRLANMSKKLVSGTKRPLTFDEVGKGLAFALVNKEMLIRSNPKGSDLWVDFSPISDVDLITEGLMNL